MTDSDGRFTFAKVPVRSYRLVAQSWRKKASIRSLMDVNGEEIELHGVANDVRVTANTTSDVVLHPWVRAPCGWIRRFPTMRHF